MTYQLICRLVVWFLQKFISHVCFGRPYKVRYVWTRPYKSNMNWTWYIGYEVTVFSIIFCTFNSLLHWEWRRRKNQLKWLRRGRRTMSKQKIIKHCLHIITIIVDSPFLMDKSSVSVSLSLPFFLEFFCQHCLSVCANCQTKTDVSVEILWPIW